MKTRLIRRGIMKKFNTIYYYINVPKLRESEHMLIGIGRTKEACQKDFIDTIDRIFKKRR